jgi:hypothetical protein
LPLIRPVRRMPNLHYSYIKQILRIRLHLFVPPKLPHLLSQLTRNQLRRWGAWLILGARSALNLRSKGRGTPAIFSRHSNHLPSVSPAFASRFLRSLCLCVCLAVQRSHCVPAGLYHYLQESSEQEKSSLCYKPETDDEQVSIRIWSVSNHDPIRKTRTDF